MVNVDEQIRHHPCQYHIHVGHWRIRIGRINRIRLAVAVCIDIEIGDTVAIGIVIEDVSYRVIRIRHHNVHIGLRRVLRINRVRLAIKILVNDVLVGLAVTVVSSFRTIFLSGSLGSGTTIALG
ncbi:MAG: hypothetical protein ACLUVF_10005 [Adlercreutzia sp.]